MSTENSLTDDQRREAATLAFEDAGREITQSFDVLSGNLTLAAGTLAALLAVIGAGELFKGHDVSVTVTGSNAGASVSEAPTVAGIPKLTSVSLLLLAIGLPLVWRFFVRATLGYQQLERFNLVKNAQWRYLSGQSSWDHARTYYDIYVARWRSPKELWPLVRGSAKYGFIWVFALYITVLGWAFDTASGVAPRLVAAAVVIVGIGFDVHTLRKSTVFKQPNAAEKAQLNALRDAMKAADAQ